MSWRIEGRYFENCPCDAPCPCTVSFDWPADVERCTPLMIYHIDDGTVEGVDMAGLTVILFVDAPQMMLSGSWRGGLIIDAAASDEQAEKLDLLFRGSLGGPMALLFPLVSEDLGTLRLPIEFSSEGGEHRVVAGDAIDISSRDAVPIGAPEPVPVRWENLTHPASRVLTVAKAIASRADIFGYGLRMKDKSSFSTHFSWSA